jgi:hypothetical protein
MALHRLLLVLALCPAALAQTSYGIGRAPTAEEMRAWDISIGPTGRELPSGQGTAKEGAAIYARKCAGCHGANGNSGGHAPTLIKARNPQKPASPVPCLAPCVNDNNTMALHSPEATVIWDYINRGMPLGKEGSLAPNEVYSLTAFLLYRNEVIREDEVMDARSLPKVTMPNRNGAAMPPPWKHGEPRLQGYP